MSSHTCFNTYQIIKLNFQLFLQAFLKIFFQKAKHLYKVSLEMIGSESLLNYSLFMLSARSKFHFGLLSKRRGVVVTVVVVLVVVVCVKVRSLKQS